jgi:hypothetical protein
MCESCGPLDRLTRRAVLTAAVGALAAARTIVRSEPAVAGSADSIAVAPGLTIHRRAAWAGDQHPAGRLDAEDVRFLLVHHTAGSNRYGPDAVTGILRSTYGYHTGPDKRWPDVAYNFFIDRFGGVWEGRAGSLDGPVKVDATGGSQGFAQLVCLLGDFTTEMPTLAALASLHATLAWLADRYALDTTPGATTTFVSRGSNRWPKGKPVVASVISGHRDMSQTACPGDAFYPYVRDRLPAAVDLARRGSFPAPTVVPAPSVAPSLLPAETTAPGRATTSRVAVSPSPGSTSPSPSVQPATGRDASSTTQAPSAPVGATAPGSLPGSLPSVSLVEATPPTTAPGDDDGGVGFVPATAMIAGLGAVVAGTAFVRRSRRGEPS